MGNPAQSGGPGSPGRPLSPLAWAGGGFLCSPRCPTGARPAQVPGLQTNEDLGAEGRVISFLPLCASRGAIKTTDRGRRALAPRRTRETNMDHLGSDNYDYSDYDNSTTDPSVPVDNSSYTPPRLGTPDVMSLAIFAVVFLVGVPGNLMVVWVTGCEARRAINAIWFLNLAAADLLSCLSLPILFVNILHHNDWSFGEAACRLLPSLLLLNLFASILLLAAISADRFLLVFNPIWCQNYRGPRLAWVACAVAWGLALLLTIPSFVYRKLNVQHFPAKMECGLSYGRDAAGVRRERAVATVRLVVGFLCPLATLSVCYTFLLLRTWSRSATRSTKTLKVVAAVVASFFLLWLPYQVSGMALAFLPESHRHYKAVSRFDALCVSIAYVNSCINPVIYVVAAQGFQARVLKSLPARLRNVLTEESVARGSKSFTSKSFTLSTVDQKSQAAV